jgi:NADH-quinone oxidoreductase subunit M
MGTYGIIRYGMPMFPSAMFWAAPVIGLLSVIGIIYGALVAYVQKDVKKLVAYSSVSHLGFVVLGLAAMTPKAVTGAMFQGLAHGIATSGLFLCIGILYERRHTRLMSEFGGLTKKMPVFAVFFIIIAMASAGLPGLVGFVGEYLILIGSFDAFTFSFGDLSVLNGQVAIGPETMSVIYVALAALGVVLGALYLLHMIQETMFGTLDEEKNGAVKDINGREITYLLPIVLMSFFMGIQPQIFLRDIEPAVVRTLTDTFENMSEEQLQRARSWSATRTRGVQEWQSQSPGEEWSIQKAHSKPHDGDHEEASEGHGDVQHEEDNH